MQLWNAETSTMRNASQKLHHRWRPAAVVYKARSGQSRRLPPQVRGQQKLRSWGKTTGKGRPGAWERTGDSVPQLGCRFDVAHHRSCFGAPRHGPKYKRTNLSRCVFGGWRNKGSQIRVYGTPTKQTTKRPTVGDRPWRPWPVPAANRNTPSPSFAVLLFVKRLGRSQISTSLDGCVRRPSPCLLSAGCPIGPPDNCQCSPPQNICSTASQLQSTRHSIAPINLLSKQDELFCFLSPSS